MPRFDKFQERYPELRAMEGVFPIKLGEKNLSAVLHAFAKEMIFHPESPVPRPLWESWEDKFGRLFSGLEDQGEQRASSIPARDLFRNRASQVFYQLVEAWITISRIKSNVPTFSKFLVQNGYPGDMVSYLSRKIADKINPPILPEIVISTRYRDILRCSQTKFFGSCYAPDGANSGHPKGLCKAAPGVAIAFVRTRSGEIHSRTFLVFTKVWRIHQEFEHWPGSPQHYETNLNFVEEAPAVWPVRNYGDVDVATLLQQVPGLRVVDIADNTKKSPQHGALLLAPRPTWEHAESPYLYDFVMMRGRASIAVYKHCVKIGGSNSD